MTLDEPTLAMICADNSSMVWRVELCEDGRVKTTYIGLMPVDVSREQYYEDLSSCPAWLQDRVAVLNMMPSTPVHSVVYGVGMRVSDTVFWAVE